MESVNVTSPDFSEEMLALFNRTFLKEVTMPEQALNPVRSILRQ